MQCGFKLFKTFSYLKFFDKRVLNLYIVKDKNLKREMKINKKEIIKSAKFVKKYMNENNIDSLSRYCNLNNGSQKVVIDHYVHNKIDKFFLVWLIKTGVLYLNDNDRAYMPYIITQYREILVKNEDIQDFFNKLKGSL